MRNALQVPLDSTGSPANSPGRSTIFAFFASGLGWEAARGVATLVIAVPFLLFLVAVLGISMHILTLATYATLLAFVYLGCRDLVRVYRTLQDPESARVRVDVAQTASLDEWKGGPALGPPSVTEHTTFRLEHPVDQASEKER